MGYTLAGIIVPIGIGIGIDHPQEEMSAIIFLAEITGDHPAIGGIFPNAPVQIADADLRPLGAEDVDAMTASRIVNVEKKIIVQFERGPEGVQGTARHGGGDIFAGVPHKSGGQAAIGRGAAVTALVGKIVVVHHILAVAACRPGQPVVECQRRQRRIADHFFRRPLVQIDAQPCRFR